MTGKYTGQWECLLPEWPPLSGGSPFAAVEMEETPQIEKTLQQLAGQKSPEVSGDTKAWHCQKDKGQAKQQANDVHDKDMSCHTQSLQDTGKSGIQIDKGTDEA